MEMDRERLRDNQKSGAMFPHPIERLLRAGTCLSHQSRGFLRTAAVSPPSKLEPLQTGSVSPPMKLGRPSPKARAYAFVIRENPEGKSVLPFHQTWAPLRARAVPLQQIRGSPMI